MPQVQNVLRAIASAPHPLTSRELAEVVGIDYRRNFNKREGRYAKKLAGFIQRIKTPASTGNRHVLRWSLAEAWKGHDVDAILRAFSAPPVVALVPQGTQALTVTH